MLSRRRQRISLIRAEQKEVAWRRGGAAAKFETRTAAPRGDFVCISIRGQILVAGGPRGSLGVHRICARGHRDNGVFALLVVAFR